LGLAVPLYTRDAHDLTAAHRQRDIVHCDHAATVDRGDALEAEHLVGGVRLGVFDAQQYLAAHHQRGDVGLAEARRWLRGNVFAVANHGDVVGYGEHLAQLVRDKHDRAALRREIVHHDEELV